MKSCRSHRFLHTVLAMGTALFVAPLALGQLSHYGPINQFGYPDRYVDFNGLELAHANSATDPFQINDPTTLPFPTSPLDVATGNFFSEAFYWLADATMPTSGGTAMLIMGTEGAFFNSAGVVVDGDQGVFSRHRLRIDIVVPGHYTVTTPYGVFQYDIGPADIGGRAINDTIDSINVCGFCPNNRFDTPLDATATVIGPTWLTWENYQTTAPAGYIGNPNVLHRVTGSPMGNNFFRIEGPNIGGLGVNMIQTDLFTVMGMIAPPPIVDCNGNGIADEDDIAAGTSADCNNNGVPDECDLAGGSSQDVNGNGIPDECDPDCNGNGVPDDTDIAAGTSNDCDRNGVPDECDIADGTLDDRDGNGIPDKCEIRDLNVPVFGSPFFGPPFPFRGSWSGATTTDRVMNILKNYGASCLRHCPQDIAPPGGDGVVDVQDLIAVLGTRR